MLLLKILYFGDYNFDLIFKGVLDFKLRSIIVLIRFLGFYFGASLEDIVFFVIFDVIYLINLC